MDSPIAPKPGRSRYGPVCPKPESRTMIRRGLSFESTSQPRPHFSSAPGRKFSITMSASAASRRTISCASGCFRFSVTDFLLRACAYHQSDVPWCSLRHFRNGSPPSGDSILITSAPNSASTRAQNGPAIKVPSSITLTPCSGRDLASLMITLLPARADRSVSSASRPGAIPRTRPWRGVALRCVVDPPAATRWVVRWR